MFLWLLINSFSQTFNLKVVGLSHDLWCCVFSFYTPPPLLHPWRCVNGYWPTARPGKPNKINVGSPWWTASHPEDSTKLHLVASCYRVLGLLGGGTFSSKCGVYS